MSAIAGSGNGLIRPELVCHICRLAGMLPLGIVNFWGRDIQGAVHSFPLCLHVLMRVARRA